ncbi:MAG: GTP-binding protein [Thermoplasmata archaeon]|nr:GTP-binding protein [Thermoplasmata archaeon]
MPLFKRRDKKDGREKEEKPEGKKPPGEGVEKPEDEPTEPKEGEEEEGAEQPEDEDDEGEDEPSIDELIEGIEAHGGEGAADRPVDMNEALGELTGEDVKLVKMAKKVVVIGDPAVGKTSLIKRYVQDVFDDRYLNTIGAKVMKKELGVNRPDTGEIVDLKLILWDIAGQETYEIVKKAYYRGASGAIVVCDSTRKETMDDLHRWIENLFDVSDVIPMVIIVNKIDLDEEAQFTEEQVRKEYAPYGAGIFMTSAKTGENVERIFHELGKLISR